MVSEGGSGNYWPKYGLTIHIGLSWFYMHWPLGTVMQWKVYSRDPSWPLQVVVQFILSCCIPNSFYGARSPGILFHRFPQVEEIIPNLPGVHTMFLAPL